MHYLPVLQYYLFNYFTFTLNSLTLTFLYLPADCNFLQSMHNSEYQKYEQQKEESKKRKQSIGGNEQNMPVKKQATLSFARSSNLSVRRRQSDNSIHYRRNETIENGRN